MDKFGTKIGYGVSIVAWSMAAIGHALVSTIGGFYVARVMLGLGEGGNFPSAIKTVALWFPKRERATATAIFGAGTNVGAIAAPLLVPAIAQTFGWQWAFIFAGIAGFLWLFFWVPFYNVPEKIKAKNAAELRLIRSDRDDTSRDGEKISWLSLLGYRQTWAFVLAKALTDPVGWFFSRGCRISSSRRAISTSKKADTCSRRFTAWRRCRAFSVAGWSAPSRHSVGASLAPARPG